MTKIILIAVQLIVLHGPHDEPIALNAAEISSLRAPGIGDGSYPPDVRCVVVMTNGKFFGVVETCREVFLKTKDPT